MKTLETKNVPEPGGEALRAACERIAASTGFRNSDRMVRFLRFVVEKHLSGEADQLKEYLLGIEVFDRPESFDPKADTIVRVEARRLRKKLKEYYDGEGAAEVLRIDIPRPGYVPVVTSIETDAEAEPAVEAPVVQQRRRWLPTAVAAVVLLALVLLWMYRPSAENARIDSIAVLPFSDMSAAKDQEFFCDGFTEELISSLASASGLRVVARTSTFAFKGKNTDIREIGHQLNAGAIIEGSVRRSGTTMRVTVQLIRASDGYHIWAKSFDRNTEDVLAMQQEISQQIVSSFSKSLGGVRTASELKIANLEAHDLYLVGRYQLNKFEPASIEKAMGYFQKAIELDPRSAESYSGLADAYSYLIDMDYMPTSQILTMARNAADKALELAPNLADAHTARGLVAHELEWDQARAEKEFKRAIELRPSFAYGIHWYAHFLESQGKMEEALAEMRRALAMDPLSRMYTTDAGMIMWKMHRNDEAAAFARRVQELDPEYMFLDIMLGGVYRGKGDWPTAMKHYRAIRAKMPEVPLVVGMLAQAEALSGNAAGARRELAALVDLSKKSYVPDYLFALVYDSLGNHEAARGSLKKAVDAHSGLLIWMSNSPLFDGLRADPGCKELLAKIGH